MILLARLPRGLAFIKSSCQVLLIILDLMQLDLLEQHAEEITFCAY